jgi:hypothetical protein
VNVDFLTESPTADTASGNPLDLLLLRQFVVFVVRAHQRPLTDLAERFGLSRDTRPSRQRADPRPGAASGGRGSSWTTARAGSAEAIVYPHSRVSSMAVYLDVDVKNYDVSDPASR